MKNKTIGLTYCQTLNTCTITPCMPPQGSALSKQHTESTRGNQKHLLNRGLKKCPMQKNEQTTYEQCARHSRPSYGMPKTRKQGTITRSTPLKLSGQGTRCFSVQKT